MFFGNILCAIPIAVTSNIWIIPSTTQTLGSAIMIICLGKATSTVPLQWPFHIVRLFPVFSATSRHFHLTPHYEDHTIMTNISLDTANINAINISTLDFRIWQHFSSNWTQPTCRNWQIFLMFQSHSCTEIWSTLVNQLTYLQSRMTTKAHPSYWQSEHTPGHK